MDQIQDWGQPGHLQSRESPLTLPGKPPHMRVFLSSAQVRHNSPGFPLPFRPLAPSMIVSVQVYKMAAEQRTPKEDVVSCNDFTSQQSLWWCFCAAVAVAARETTLFQ